MAQVGKRAGGFIYIHKDALGAVGDRTRTVIMAAASVAAGMPWNVAKTRGDEVSLLLYEDFDEVAFPALLYAHTVNLREGSVKSVDYRNRANPPILHRKELLLSCNDPRRPTFAALTRAAELHGLFANSESIGTRNRWERRIEGAGLELRGHLLIDTRTRVVDVLRHKTAIARRDLSQPMALMLRYELIRRGTSVFDYGCGLGDDIAALVANGYNAFGWDPHHAPDGSRRSADVVNLGFVLNVIEDPHERLETLHSAWSFAKRVITVSVMPVGKVQLSGLTPYKDGFITSRGTFQRYFAQNELKDLVENALGEQPIALAPGIVAVFRDKELEQEFRYRRRSQACLLAQQFVIPPKPVQRPPKVRPLGERIGSELSGIWRRALELGRLPEPDELPHEVIEGLAAARVSAQRAIAACSDGMFDHAVLDGAAAARQGDLLVHLALSLFPGAPRYASLPRSIQRDIRTFFGSLAVALERARSLLFSAGDREVIDSNIKAAKMTGLGAMRDSHTFRAHGPNVARLPALLRVLAGCAEILEDSISEADFVDISLSDMKLTFIVCDDVSLRLPLITRRIKVDLRRQRVAVDDRLGNVLYLKGRFLAHDDPDREAQIQFDQRLLDSGVVTLDCRGPSWEELRRRVRDLDRLLAQQYDPPPG